MFNYPFAYMGVSSHLVGALEDPRHLRRTDMTQKLQKCFAFLDWQLETKMIQDDMSNVCI